jgi:transposase
MQLKTILNFVHPIKGFIYESIQWDTPGVSFKVALRSRKNSQGVCSGCGRAGSTYDHCRPRRFDFVPLWGLAVVLVYALRRINCPSCGVKVERIPWAAGKNRQTTALQVFLARWAQRLSWKETASVFGVTWDAVFRAVRAVVAYGLTQRSLDNVTAIGVDEIAWRKGHRYLTLVYQIDAGCRRLLYIAEGRTIRSLLGFFHEFGRERAAHIRYVCSDMWPAYLKVLAKKTPSALHILDRFHIVANLNKALDRVRAAEAKRLQAEGYEPVLKKTRWCFMKRRKNLTAGQRFRLKDVLRYDLKTVRAYLLSQAFDALWSYRSAAWAGKFLDGWIHHVMRSRIDPLKKVARSLRKHRELILNWFRAKKEFNSGIVEGLNGKAKLAFRKAYGYRTFQAAEVSLYHQLGHLPEPELTHSFC